MRFAGAAYVLLLLTACLLRGKHTRTVLALRHGPAGYALQCMATCNTCSLSQPVYGLLVQEAYHE